MQLLKEDEPEKFQSHFSGFIKEGIEADDLAEMYTKVHAAIRADPAQQKTEKKAPAEPKRCALLMPEDTVILKLL
jgi:large subunit ribosomal protein L5e